MIINLKIDTDNNKLKIRFKYEMKQHLSLQNTHFIIDGYHKLIIMH